MTDAEKMEFKQKLFLFCEHALQERIQVVRNLIAEAQASANNEEKSSAGDKYETGRAMGHIQREMYERQLGMQLKEQAGLASIKVGQLYKAACSGACVVTSEACFFIAAGLGMQQVDEKTVYFISPQAPLSALLNGKQQGDHFLFNKKQMVISMLF